MTQVNNHNEERRGQRRLYGFFPVQVRGRCSGGQVFEISALAENISDGGLYLQMPSHLLLCERIFSLTRLPGGASLATHGLIVRQETPSHGSSGVAVRFSRSRLIPAPPSN
jgi:hypothetical protein